MISIVNRQREVCLAAIAAALLSLATPASAQSFSKDYVKITEECNFAMEWYDKKRDAIDAGKLLPDEYLNSLNINSRLLYLNMVDCDSKLSMLNPLTLHDRSITTLTREGYKGVRDRLKTHNGEPISEMPR